MGKITFLKPGAQEDFGGGMSLIDISQKYGPGTIHMDPLTQDDYSKLGVTPEEASQPGWKPELSAIQAIIDKKRASAQSAPPVQSESPQATVVAPSVAASQAAAPAVPLAPSSAPTTQATPVEYTDAVAEMKKAVSDRTGFAGGIFAVVYNDVVDTYRQFGRKYKEVTLQHQVPEDIASAKLEDALGGDGVDGAWNLEDLKYLPRNVGPDAVKIVDSIPGLVADFVGSVEAVAMGGRSGGSREGRSHNERVEATRFHELQVVDRAYENGDGWAALDERTWMPIKANVFDLDRVIKFYENLPEADPGFHMPTPGAAIHPDDKLASLKLLKSLRRAMLKNPSDPEMEIGEFFGPAGTSLLDRGPGGEIIRFPRYYDQEKGATTIMVPLHTTNWVDVRDKDAHLRATMSVNAKARHLKEDPIWGDKAFVPALLGSTWDWFLGGPERWTRHPLEAVVYARGGLAILRGGVGMGRFVVEKAGKGIAGKAPAIDAAPGTGEMLLEKEGGPAKTAHQRESIQDREGAALAQELESATGLEGPNPSPDLQARIDAWVAAERQARAADLVIEQTARESVLSDIGLDAGEAGPDPVVMATASAAVRKGMGNSVRGRIAAPFVLATKAMRGVESGLATAESMISLGAVLHGAAKLIEGGSRIADNLIKARIMDPALNRAHANTRSFWAKVEGWGLEDDLMKITKLADEQTPAGSATQLARSQLQWRTSGPGALKKLKDEQRGAKPGVKEPVLVRAANAITGVYDSLLPTAALFVGPGGIINVAVEHFKDTMARMHPDISGKMAEIGQSYARAYGEIITQLALIQRNPGLLAVATEAWSKGGGTRIVKVSMEAPEGLSPVALKQWQATRNVAATQTAKKLKSEGRAVKAEPGETQADAIARVMGVEFAGEFMLRINGAGKNFSEGFEFPIEGLDLEASAIALSTIHELAPDLYGALVKRVSALEEMLPLKEEQIRGRIQSSMLDISKKKTPQHVRSAIDEFQGSMSNLREATEMYTTATRKMDLTKAIDDVKILAEEVKKYETVEEAGVSQTTMDYAPAEATTSPVVEAESVTLTQGVTDAMNRLAAAKQAYQDALDSTRNIHPYTKEFLKKERTANQLFEAGKDPDLHPDAAKAYRRLSRLRGNLNMAIKTLEKEKASPPKAAKPEKTKTEALQHIEGAGVGKEKNAPAIYAVPPDWRLSSRVSSLGKHVNLKGKDARNIRGRTSWDAREIELGPRAKGEALRHEIRHATLLEMELKQKNIFNTMVDEYYEHVNAITLRDYWARISNAELPELEIRRLQELPLTDQVHEVLQAALRGFWEEPEVLKAELPKIYDGFVKAGLEPAEFAKRVKSENWLAVEGETLGKPVSQLENAPQAPPTGPSTHASEAPGRAAKTRSEFVPTENVNALLTNERVVALREAMLKKHPFLKKYLDTAVTSHQLRRLAARMDRPLEALKKERDGALSASEAAEKKMADSLHRIGVAYDDPIQGVAAMIKHLNPQAAAKVLSGDFETFTKQSSILFTLMDEIGEKGWRDSIAKAPLSLIEQHLDTLSPEGVKAVAKSLGVSEEGAPVIQTVSKKATKREFLKSRAEAKEKVKDLDPEAQAEAMRDWKKTWNAQAEKNVARLDLRESIKREIAKRKAIPDSIVADLFADKEGVTLSPQQQQARAAVVAEVQEMVEWGPARTKHNYEAMEAALVERLRVAQEEAAKTPKDVETSAKGLLREVRTRAGLPEWSEEGRLSWTPEILAKAYVDWWRGHKTLWVPSEIIGKLMSAPEVYERFSPFLGFLRREMDRVRARGTIASQMEPKFGLTERGLSERGAASKSFPEGAPLAARVRPSKAVDPARRMLEDDFPKIMDAADAAEFLTEGVVFANSGDGLLCRRAMLDAMEQLIVQSGKMGNVYLGPMHWTRFHNYFPRKYYNIEVEETSFGGKIKHKLVPNVIEPASTRSQWQPSGNQRTEGALGGLIGRPALRISKHGPRGGRAIEDPNYLFMKGMEEMTFDLHHLKWLDYLKMEKASLFKEYGDQPADWLKIPEVSVDAVRRAKGGRPQEIATAAGKAKARIPSGVEKKLKELLISKGIDPKSKIGQKFMDDQLSSFQETPAYGTLAGLYTTPEMYEFIVRGRGFVEDSIATRFKAALKENTISGQTALLLFPFLGDKVLRLLKSGKISWNPATWIRNTLTNLEVANLNGMMGVSGLQSMGRVLEKMTSKDIATKNEVARIFHEMGMDTSLITQEFSDALPRLHSKPESTPMDALPYWADTIAWMRQAEPIPPSELTLRGSTQSTAAPPAGRGAAALEGLKAAPGRLVTGALHPFRAIGGANQAMARGYGAIDAFFKYWNYEWLQHAAETEGWTGLSNRLSRVGYTPFETAKIKASLHGADGALDLKAASRFAIEEAQKWFLDYSRVPGIVKVGRQGLSGLILGSPFWTYPWKMFPRTFEMLKRHPKKAYMLSSYVSARNTFLMSMQSDASAESVNNTIAGMSPDEKGSYWWMPKISEEDIVANPKDPKWEKTKTKEFAIHGLNFRDATFADILTTRRREFQAQADTSILPDALNPFRSSFVFQAVDIVRGRHPYTQRPLAPGEAWRVALETYAPSWFYGGYAWNAAKRAAAGEPDSRGRFMSGTDVFLSYFLALKSYKITQEGNQRRMEQDFEYAKRDLQAEFQAEIDREEKDGTPEGKALWEERRDEAVFQLESAAWIAYGRQGPEPLDRKKRQELIEELWLQQQLKANRASGARR